MFVVVYERGVKVYVIVDSIGVYYVFLLVVKVLRKVGIVVVLFMSILCFGSFVFFNLCMY